ncbi:hypothetical protein [Pontibacter pamirensis]|uniref:hypothetical protein n=1 Tax=Pontibacter pamirensis TaxID=2562824 RepID=UPI001389DFB6|nr:hypothetical protein [Pontibacter pamirensis]
MDITSVIIGLISLALFAVPVMLIQRKQKQQKQKQLQHFLDIAQQQQLTITQHDLWNHHFAIGIDTEQSILLFLKKRAEGEGMLLLHLSEVAACRVNNVNREVAGNRVIDLIELRFTFQVSGLREQAVEFYNREESMSLNEELLLAEKWRDIVSTHLQNPQPQRSNTAYKGGSAAFV